MTSHSRARAVSLDVPAPGASISAPALSQLPAAELESLLQQQKSHLHGLSSENPHNSQVHAVTAYIGQIETHLARRKSSNGVQSRNRSLTLDTLNINPVAHHPTRPAEPSMTGVVSPTWLLSDILQSFSTKDKDEYFIVSKGNDLVVLLSEHPQLTSDIMLQNFINKVQFMFYHPSLHVRAVGYRILRYVVSDYDSLRVLVQAKILIFIIVTLSTVDSTDLEKEQALKLIRGFVHIPGGCDNLSIGVVKSLVALVQDDEDDEADDHVSENFRKICVETICEIALVKAELVFHSGGFKMLINTIMGGSNESSLTCTFVLMKLLDSPDSRNFLRNGLDISSLLSIYSDSSDNDDDTSKTRNNKRTHNRLLKVSFAVTLLLKNWNGLICFSHNNFQMLNNLILNLKKRNVRLRSAIMDILLDVLRIQALPWLESSSIGDSLVKLNSHLNNSHYNFLYQQLNEESFEFNLVNHYLGFLVKILINNDIIPLLLTILEENLSLENSLKASTLITKLLEMSKTLLPASLVSTDQLHSSNIFSMSKIETIIRLQKNKDNPERQKDLRTYIKNIIVKERYDMDDNEIKSMIINSKILTIKESNEWSWYHLLNLIQGPLRNPKRFDELLEKNPKFLKRLMSFYRPFKFRFCNIGLQEHTKKYITIGCQLIETLLSLDQGVQYLSNNKILPQLSEIFTQVDPFSGILAKDPILLKRRLETTLSIGYVKFIGTLSNNPIGIKMLEQWQFFNIFSNIIEGSVQDENNNYLIMCLLNSINFILDSPFRTLLSKALSISNLRIRSFILDSILPSLLKVKETEFFTLKNLITLIYDPHYDIVRKAIDYLYDYFIVNRNEQALNYLVNFRPSLKILLDFENGNLLILNFLKTPEGFKYLYDNDYINSNFERITKKRQDFLYLQQIETAVDCLMFPYFSTLDSNYKLNRHFFYYLLSTEEGFNYFNNDRGYLDLIIREVGIFIKRLNLLEGEFHRHSETFFDKDLEEEEEVLLINTLKHHLWVIGEIASSKHGILLLDPVYSANLKNQNHIIETIIKLFYKSSHWQLRGCALFQLGKISSTIEGLEILDELNWSSLNKGSLNLAYPKELETNSDVFQIEDVNPYRDSKYYTLFGSNDGTSALNDFFDLDQGPEDLTGIETYDKLNDKILNLVSYLGSGWGKIERKTIKRLLMIKRETPKVYENVTLFLKIIKIVDKGSYKFQLKNFIFHDLFKDTKILETLVKRNRKPLP